MAVYNERNEEVPDPTPIELPIGYKKPETLQEMIARMVDVHSTLAERAGHETFEEADDFEVGDDSEDPVSRYQLHAMQEEFVLPKEEKSEVSPKEHTEQPKAEPAATVKT